MGVVEKISWMPKLEAIRAVVCRYAGDEKSVDSIQIHMIVRHVWMLKVMYKKNQQVSLSLKNRNHGMRLDGIVFNVASLITLDMKNVRIEAQSEQIGNERFEAIITILLLRSASDEVQIRFWMRLSGNVCTELLKMILIVQFEKCVANPDS